MARILLVDDERSIRMTLRVFLTNAGHEVDLAEEAEEALEKIENGPYDVLITDIILPKMSGVELVHEVRKRNSKLQMIMMTGEPSVETAAAAVRAGALDYITKPVSRPAILKVVNQALRITAIEEERRRLEEENRRHQELLERRVAERTTELSKANERLQRSIESVKRTHVAASGQERLRVLGKLTAGLAEDFGNALTRIQAELHPLLKPGGLDNPALAVAGLKNIGAVVRQARQLVWKMREFYHPHETLRMDLVPLDELAQEVIEPVRSGKAPGLNGPVRVNLKLAEHCVIAGDREQLKDAVQQIVDNAVEAMSDGGDLSLTAETDDANVTLTISDNGPGMDEPTCKRCFEPFFTTKEDGSPGVGLSTARSVVALHGGAIQVSSRPDEGTTVVMRLPRGEPPL